MTGRKPRRTLVTGGAGFIGSNFVHHLIENTESSVVTLDTLTYAGSTDHLDGVMDHPRHEFVHGDIRDEELVADLVDGVDAVVNFAAESHVDRSIEVAKPFVSTNIEGTRTLLDVVREADINRFVQISTDEVYGEIHEGTFHESDPLSPRNPYAATKAGADHLALSYHTTYDVPITVTRSSNNYGPRQHPEKLIPKFIERAYAGQSLPLYGDGTNVREWLYVTDNCRAIETVLRKGTPGEVYNIGSGVELRNIDLTKRILDEVGESDDLIEFVDDRAGHDERYAVDTAKIENLGWSPQVPFEEGLKRTIEFYRTEAD